MACNKTFANENVFQHHKKGKQHIKAVNEMSRNGETLKKEENKSEFSE